MNIPGEAYGYVKLDGKGVAEGKIDLTKASGFLKGVDENLRFFIERENTGYSSIDYNLEVKIEPGSVLILFLGLVGTAFVSAAAAQLGKNMIGDRDPGDILIASVRKVKSTAKIAKHLGGIDRKKVEDTKFKDNNRLIGIPNSKGQYLYVTQEEWETFFAAPRNLYEDMVNPVGEDISLSIGAKEEDGSFVEEKIDKEDAPIFSGSMIKDETSDVVLPELKDGEYVELEGELTRGNGVTNTFGFRHKDHIITCTLQKGRVKDHKQELFGKVRITGQVTRHYESRVSDEEKNKPKIIFDSIVGLEGNSDQAKLL